MQELQLIRVPEAKAAMLIRRPIAEVFEAFVDPAKTAAFWFTRGSGLLVAGREVLWEWEMFQASARVRVKAVEEPRRILLEWGEESTPTQVEWTFTPHGEGATFVCIVESGFSGNGDQVVQYALESVGGFTLVLAASKPILSTMSRSILLPTAILKGALRHPFARHIAEKRPIASKKDAMGFVLNAVLHGKDDAQNPLIQCLFPAYAAL
uniref:Activator of Hsp90 ATPase homologue 1/2-like C-terminal domain-containing protein n=1 Tax=Thermosporothrix sp. COM3 TaxID=2490863 RepID=A0A455SJ20_9CHLR|nr:hypothetical protein KTC_23110 [Thermosporothrix sp. COM3]